jgi:hypothetical protein
MSVTGPGRGTDVGAADAGEVADVADEVAALSPARSGSSAGASAVAKLEATLLAKGSIDAAGAQALVKAAADSSGVTDAERTAFVGLLRQHGSEITPAALEVLAKHFNVPLRRPGPAGPVTPPPAGPAAGAGDLKISGSQAGQTIRGTAKPGDTIEAINLSTAPDARLHLEDTTAIGKADAQGNFAGKIPDMQEGDVIRLRTLSASGATGPWVTIHATGVAAQDTRNAELNVDRTNLTAKPDGSVEINQITDRPITEPGAKVRFVNDRTGAKFDMTASADGGVPPGFKLQGKAGDTFSVAVSDGHTNADFKTTAGKLTVGGGATPPTPTTTGPEPKLGPGDHGYTLTAFHGPLFQNGISPEDVQQGALGDCYFPATFAAIANSRPDAIKNMIKDNGDGTYTVRFYENGDKSQPKDVTVDNKLYVRSSGTPLYGESSDTPDTPANMEMWFPIIEKAYAQWKGGYDAIGKGGNPGDLFAEALGTRGQDYDLPHANPDTVFGNIKSGLAAGKPVAAVTYSDAHKALYVNTGVYSDHTYSIIGTKEQNGQRFVTLRNPWGESVPAGEGDGKTDGIFNMPLADFQKLYESFSVAGA